MLARTYCETSSAKTPFTEYQLEGTRSVPIVKCSRSIKRAYRKVFMEYHRKVLSVPIVAPSCIRPVSTARNALCPSKVKNANEYPFQFSSRKTQPFADFPNLWIEVYLPSVRVFQMGRIGGGTHSSSSAHRQSRSAKTARIEPESLRPRSLNS